LPSRERPPWRPITVASSPCSSTDRATRCRRTGHNVVGSVVGGQRIGGEACETTGLPCPERCDEPLARHRSGAVHREALRVGSLSEWDALVVHPLPPSVVRVTCDARSRCSAGSRRSLFLPLTLDLREDGLRPARDGLEIGRCVGRVAVGHIVSVAPLVDGHHALRERRERLHAGRIGLQVLHPVILPSGRDAPIGDGGGHEVLAIASLLLRDERAGLRQPGLRLLPHGLVDENRAFRQPKLLATGCCDRLLLRLPLAGEVIVKTEVARFTRIPGTLLKSGVAMIPALTVVKDMVGNQVLARAVDSLGDGVRRGAGLARPMAAARTFPPLAVHMVRVGEETGRLEETLLQVAASLEADTRKLVKRLIALAEPCIILVMGLVVGFIVVAMLLAILSVTDLPI